MVDNGSHFRTSQGDVANETERQLIAVEEAAVLLGRSVKTVWRYLEDGKLTRREVLGRTLVDRAEIMKLLTPTVKAPR